MQARWRNFMAVLTTALAIFLVATALPAHAAGTPAGDRTGASGPETGMVQIGAGETQWYKFHYHFDNSKHDNVPTEALVMLKSADGSGALSFSIETPGSLAQPKLDADGKANGPVGRGSQVMYKIDETDVTEAQHKIDQKLANADGLVPMRGCLIWSGSARASDTYYVVVKNSSNQAQAYNLSITGPDVSY